MDKRKSATLAKTNLEETIKETIRGMGLEPFNYIKSKFNIKQGSDYLDLARLNVAMFVYANQGNPTFYYDVVNVITGNYDRVRITYGNFIACCIAKYLEECGYNVKYNNPSVVKYKNILLSKVLV